MSTLLTAPSLSIQTRATLTSGTFPILTATISHAPTVSLTAGNAAGQVDVLIEKTLSITTGTPFTVNVSTGLDPFGTAAGMVHVTAVIVENSSTNSGQDFTVGGGTHPILGADSFFIQANGGSICVCNPSPGYTVVVGTTDTLTITVAAGTSVAGKLTILGRTA